MRIDPTIKIRSIAGEHLVIRTNADNLDLTRAIALNDTAVFLMQRLQNKSFTLEDVVNIICEEYDIDHNTAYRDADIWLKKMLENGLVLTEE